ncbi:IPT/TIG domain-containing protein [Flavobacterium sp. UGB4466]|uniref:IPT/TIG domain-containing protein n=1 Tax=Flavobacterium sp. UGB4466 TaxID=2730889 RepID=UPI00192AFFFC|nr:IPT/TIG domain-containing protein [Flavobacterium sp. UGB4466]
MNTYLSNNFQVPSITFSGITETSLTINKLYISSAGIFDIAVDFDFGNGQGWTIFPGFKLDHVGFEVNYATIPVIDSFTPATSAAGAVITIEGNNLLGTGATGTKVYFGTTTTFSSTDPSAVAAAGGTATQISVTLPSALQAGTYYLFVENADKTSSASGTTLTIS